MSRHPSKSVRVLFTENELFREELRGFIPGNWECSFDYFADQQSLVNKIASWGPEVVFVGLGLHFAREHFAASKALRLVATPTTGLDHIDLQAAQACGVEVLSLRGQISFLRTVTSTAEHAWTLLLAASRSLFESARRPVEGNWSRHGLEIHQLAGKQLGIIGIGRLGTMLASYGLAFQMKVVATDPQVDAASVETHVQLVGLNELLAKSDYVILAASYSDGDQPILRSEHFGIVKFGVVLVNISRGELIDEAALIRALEVGTVRSAALDVVVGDSRWNKTGFADSPILKFARVSDRIIITPHVGGYAIEAVVAARRFLIKRVENWHSSNSFGAL